MNQKPKIQYVGQFYIHGSEARQLELQEKKKHAKSKLPLERLRKVEVIYLDPVAIFGIVTALVLHAPAAVVCFAIQSENFCKMPWGIVRLRSRKWINSVTRGGEDL